MVWHIGNTTIRTPYRLRQALIALHGTSLHGNLQGREQEKHFAELLHEHEIAQITEARLIKGDYDDLGRKWRAALTQLGFITPALSTKFDQTVLLVEGPFRITPNGHRLIESGIITAQQECFLRSLLAYTIPSVLEERYHKYGFEPFQPLKFVIEVLYNLGEKGLDSFLSFDEFALFVQVSSSEHLEDVLTNIENYRIDRINHAGKLKRFKREMYDKIAEEASSIPSTLKDYADCSLRYLKATGLFKTKGRGITLSPSRGELNKLIREQQQPLIDYIEYLKTLWSGAKLPTDEKPAARRVVDYLINQVVERGGESSKIDIEGKDEADLAIIRHQLESQLLHMDEEEYATCQADCMEEISAWLHAFLNKGKSTLPSGEAISIPQGEAPAYLEWIIWRAFLAIDSLTNKPWEARRFQIDQDFLPVGTAPGNGPDMIFEFEDAIIVVEVTLTTSSRQEAAEGEPVRRHVAKYAEQFKDSNKDVYGLFIAVNIDSNTAHTFRSGDWYLKDDSKINLQIIPVQLNDFRVLFDSGKGNTSQLKVKLFDALIRCRSRANEDAPIWKRSISRIIEQIAG